MHLINILLVKFHFLFLFISNEPGEKKDSLLSVEPGLMIWTILIFVLLLIILKKYAWGPLMKSLTDREQTIKDSINRAEYLKQEAEKMLEEHKQMLAKTDEESRKIISESRQMAEKMRQDIVNKTHDDAAKILQNAKSEIEREKVAALNQLKDEIANLAIGAASKIIDENLDSEKQKKIIGNFIKQIPQY